MSCKTSCRPVESLSCENKGVCEKSECGPVTRGYSLGGGFLNLLLWFIIIAVIVWFILWALKPAFVQKRNSSGELTGQVDSAKVLWISIIIALIIVVIIWLIRVAATSWRY